MDAPKVTTTTDAAIIETRDRVRRIETRLTHYIEETGVDSGTRKPVWDGCRSTVELPSLNSSIRDIILAVPPGREGWNAINLSLRGRHIAIVSYVDYNAVHDDPLRKKP